MKNLIACLIAAVLFVIAGASALQADEIEQPNGIQVKGCPDYTLVGDRVQQLCDIDSIPPRDILSVTEFLRAFRCAGGSSDGGSEDTASIGN